MTESRDIEPALGSYNVRMLLNYVDALDVPGKEFAPGTHTAAYADGYRAGVAASRRLILDMWDAAVIGAIAVNMDVDGVLDEAEIERIKRVVR